MGVLDKVMAVLGFLERESLAAPKTVAAGLGMSTPTAYRLMKGMATHGLISADDAGRYRLGLRLLGLGHVVASRLDIVEIGRPYLVDLRNATAESVELQVLSGHRRIPVHLEAGTRSVRTSSQVGVALPIHKGASSRVLTTGHPEREALELARRSAEADGDLDSFDDDTYLSRWRTARDRGYDIGVGERDPEVGAAAAAVRGLDGTVIAQIVVSGTAQRFRDPEHADLVVRQLRHAADALTRDLARSLRG